MATRVTDVPTIVAIERKYKLEAQKRNGQAVLIILLMSACMVFIVLSVISYIETQISRFSNPLVYDIVLSGLIAGISFVYFGVMVALKKMNILPLHDNSISKNNGQQYGLLAIYVPLVISLLISVRWIGYTTSNDANQFKDLPGGVRYSWVSMATWFLSLMAMFSIFNSIFSFYKVRQPIYRFSVSRGIPWSTQLNEIVRPEYDPDTNSTVLVPKKELLS